jgi:phosphohistidine phosphatase SixA
MAKISKTKEYAIKYLSTYGKKDAEDIAKELKLSLADVNKVLQSSCKAPTKTDKTKDLMIRQTSAKKSNTVSIMTEAAAQLSDEFIKNMDTLRQKTELYF